MCILIEPLVDGMDEYEPECLGCLGCRPLVHACTEYSVQHATKPDCCFKNRTARYVLRTCWEGAFLVASSLVDEMDMPPLVLLVLLVLLVSSSSSSSFSSSPFSFAIAHALYFSVKKPFGNLMSSCVWLLFADVRQVMAGGGGWPAPFAR